MVGRVGFEPTTIGLKGQKEHYYAFYFNSLPWRPLQSVHHDAGQCITEFHKIPTMDLGRNQTYNNAGAWLSIHSWRLSTDTLRKQEILRQPFSQNGGPQLGKLHMPAWLGIRGYGQNSHIPHGPDYEEVVRSRSFS